MVQPQPVKRAFTLIELLAVIAVVAVLVVGAIFSYLSVVGWATTTANTHTLTILNDALTRYKCEGGDMSYLSGAYTVGAVLRRMAAPVQWAGTSHQFIKNSGQDTADPTKLLATGTGALYQFAYYNGTQITSGCFPDINSSTAQVSTFATGITSPGCIVYHLNGNLYVATRSTGPIYKISSSGTVSSLCAVQNTNQLAVGADGMLYATNTTLNCIYQIDPGSGAYTVWAGSGATGHTTGDKASAAITKPSGITFDSVGDAYVMTVDGYLEQIDGGGNVSILLSGMASQGHIDFDSPDNSIYVAVSMGGPIGLEKIQLPGLTTSMVRSSGLYDYYSLGVHPGTDMAYFRVSSAIYRTNKSSYQIVAGNPSNSGHTDGLALSATFSNPQGFAFDGAGNLYVADYGNNCIRKVTNQ